MKKLVGKIKINIFRNQQGMRIIDVDNNSLDVKTEQPDFFSVLFEPDQTVIPVETSQLPALQHKTSPLLALQHKTVIPMETPPTLQTLQQPALQYKSVIQRIPSNKLPLKVMQRVKK